MALEIVTIAAAAAKPKSYLAVLMELLDRLEEVSGERRGGSSDRINAASALIEAEILNSQSASSWERLWKTQRLDRANENEWIAEVRRELTRSIQADELMTG
jgi:hypothetical protein